MTRIPGSQVDELSARANRAAADAAALEDALAREVKDAERLEPRRRAAVEDHARACAAYERLRDETVDVLTDAADATEGLVEARALVAHARRRADRLGVSPDATTPALLHRTERGGRALERLRARVLTAI